MDENFEFFWERAALAHGHKCPSLFYGVSLAIAAQQKLKNPLEYLILEASSKCIRDGIKTVLQDTIFQDKLLIAPNSSFCALTIGGAGKQYRFSIYPQVRNQINQWNKELPLPEFQSRGVSYLMKMSPDELICNESVSDEEFARLTQAGKASAQK